MPSEAAHNVSPTGGITSVLRGGVVANSLCRITSLYYLQSLAIWNFLWSVTVGIICIMIAYPTTAIAKVELISPRTRIYRASLTAYVTRTFPTGVVIQAHHNWAVTMTSVTSVTSEMFWVTIRTSRSTTNLAIYFARA